MDIVNALEIACSQCHGTGKEGAKKCSACAGRGGFLTTQGQEFIRFMQRHYNPQALPEAKTAGWSQKATRQPKQAKKVPDLKED